MFLQTNNKYIENVILKKTCDNSNKNYKEHRNISKRDVLYEQN